MIRWAVSVAVAGVIAGGLEQVFRATSDNVAVYATVRDRDGRLVPGLTQDDFEIFDNGKLRPITTFSNDPQPITIGLVLDRSGSMSSRFGMVTAAAAAFVDKLDGADRASLATLNWDCAPLTTDRPRLKQLLGELPQDLGSAIWDGLDRVFGQLEPEAGRRAVLLFSDGLNIGVSGAARDTAIDNKSGCRRAPPVSDALLTDLSRRADREGFLVYAISAGTSDGGGDGSLRSLARDSGGERFRLERDDELRSAFTRIADELHHQYLLGFVPAEFDSKTHTIDVRVKRSGLDVRARRRYVAMREDAPAPVVAAAPVVIPPLARTDVELAMAQGQQNKRLQARCQTSPLSDPSVSPITYAEVTLEGPMGRIMRAAREAKAARQPFVLANVTPDMRAPVLRARATMREGPALAPPPTNDSVIDRAEPPRLKPLNAMVSVRLRSLSPPMQLLQPAPRAEPRGFTAPPLEPETRFDLAAFHALPAGDIEVIVSGVGLGGRCRISERDRLALR